MRWIPHLNMKSGVHKTQENTKQTVGGPLNGNEKQVPCLLVRYSK